jgi:outer membrane lipoprotein SlyB
MRQFLPRLTLLACVFALPCVSACAPVILANQAANLLSRPAADSSEGTVLAMRPVPTPSQPVAQPAGAGTGGSLGALGSGMTGNAGGGWSSMLSAGLGGGSMAALASSVGAGAATPPATHSEHPGQSVEFTLRMDDGTTLTVVQDDDQGLHTGDRVRVTHGDRVRVARAG